MEELFRKHDATVWATVEWRIAQDQVRSYVPSFELEKVSLPELVTYGRLVDDVATDDFGIIEEW